MILVATGAHYIIYSAYLDEIEELENQKSLTYFSNNIGRVLDFHQSVVDNLASQTVVVDLLQFGAQEEIQHWANEMQRTLPLSIGLTLFDNKGNVKGQKGRLRLSDRCLGDMQRRFDGLSIPRPPVHSQIEELAHFDLVSPVVSDGEKIGLVFASFSLDTIDQLLQELVSENQKLTITAADDYLVASVADGKLDQYDAVYIHTIENTDWKMELMVTQDNQNMFLMGLLISDMATFILISSLLYFAMKHLFKLVISDFEILSWMMQRIKLGTYRSDDINKVALEESKGAIRFIQYTAEELNNYQHKLKQESTTDELTTLYNRRMLNENLKDYLHMANTGQEVHLVIVDMDKFKAINDTYGHGVGDEVLKVFAYTLTHVSRDNDLCVRAGGDEFIVVLVDYNAEQVKQWYEALHQLLNETSQDLRKQYNMLFEFGVSAGCTRLRNDDNCSAILKRADDALYQVKENGRNHLVCY